MVSGLSIIQSIEITAIIQLAMNGAKESDLKKVKVKSVEFK